MKKIKDMTKKIILKYGGAIASCAFAFVVIAANSSCGVPFYEPGKNQKVWRILKS